MSGLQRTTAREAEEVVRAHRYASSAGLPQIGRIIFIEVGSAFGRFDVNERHRIIYLALHAAVGTKMAYAQFVPMNGVNRTAVSVDFVLIARNVDAIDAVGGKNELFAPSNRSLPHTPQYTARLALRLNPWPERLLAFHVPA